MISSQSECPSQLNTLINLKWEKYFSELLQLAILYTGKPPFICAILSTFLFDCLSGKKLLLLEK